MALVARTQRMAEAMLMLTPLFSGSGAGRWLRDGHLVRMSGVVSISDGSQNLDVIVVDPLNRTLTLDAYALSN